jgi:hypothetical protein
MATSKGTFTLDEETVRHIEDAAARLTKPKDEVVRDAVNQYHERMGFGGGKVSEAERLRRIEVLRDRTLFFHSAAGKPSWRESCTTPSAGLAGAAQIS